MTRVHPFFISRGRSPARSPCGRDKEYKTMKAVRNVSTDNTRRSDNLHHTPFSFVCYFMQMKQEVREPFLIAFYADIEHHYQEYLRIVEVSKLGEVFRALNRRVRRSVRCYAWDVVHCEGVDPAPFAWLKRITKLCVNLHSLRLVSTSWM